MKLRFIAFTLFLFALFAQKISAKEPGLVLKMAHKKEERSQPSRIQVLFPRSFQNKSRNPISVQVHVPCTKGEKSEQALAVFVDDQPPFVVRRKVSQTMTNKALISFFLPRSCLRGQHLIRLFSIDERGLIIDKHAPLYSRSFYFLDKEKASTIKFSADKPVLSLLSPYGSDSYPLGEPLLIDAHFSDKRSQVSTPKIVLSVDNQFVGIIDTERVYQLEGLDKGPHYITLIVYDGEKKCSHNTLNSCNRTVTIY